MKLAKLVVCVLVGGLVIVGCGKGKKIIGEHRRDNELLQQGLNDLHNSRYIQGRLLLNVLITTYPDSPFVSMAKLAIADSFYKESTSEALAQAEVEYKDFANFFPTHELADDALLRVAYIHMRQILAPNRDVTAAKKAEKALLAILQRYPNTDLKEEIQQRLKEVRNHVAEHYMAVARLQMKRQRLKGARGRLREVAEEYPEYAKMDETLFRLGRVFFELEEPDEASRYLARLVRQHPESKFRQRAAEMIELMDKPVPEPQPVEVAEKELPPSGNPGFFGSLLGTVMSFVISNPSMHVPHDGILLTKDESAEDLILTATQYSQLDEVITPDTSVISVGPSGGVTKPGQQTGAKVESEVKLGGAGDSSDQPNRKKSDKKGKKKNSQKKNSQGKNT